MAAQVAGRGPIGQLSGLSARPRSRAILAESVALSTSPSAMSPSTRRTFLKATLASAALCPLAGRARAAQLDPIVATAKAGLARAGARVQRQDMVGVADFSQPSRLPRFHLVDIATGKVESLLVAHGRGSDPGHTGWLQSFSNQPGSQATSNGDYVTGDYYVGEHGRSIRLHGLDASNCNAEQRAIVIHSAWYVGPSMVMEHGRLGCSEGCFAVSPFDMPKVLSRLGPGRLLVATKI